MQPLAKDREFKTIDFLTLLDLHAKVFVRVPEYTLSIWPFIKHSFGMTIAVCGAAADAFVRSVQGKTSHRDRAEWLHRWCAFLLRRLSINLSVHGQIPASGLIVSNHLSYVDILVFSALAPCAFVSKSEVRKWPIFGFFAKISGTVFVDRSRPQLAQQSVEEIQQVLAAGVSVVLFPEGTSTHGETVLPFKPALFESAVETKLPITAAHLRYSAQRGDAAQIVCYWGEMTFLPHLLRLMAQQEIDAHVSYARNGSVFNDRKLAATSLRDEVLRLSQMA
jgi:1-acyl-sn-glycerol-3-phosphate acyltransferase